jgi:hypothetical protein
MVQRHQAARLIRATRLHPHLPPNHQIQQLLGRQQRRDPHARRRRRLRRHHQHGQLRHHQVLRRQVQNLRHGRLLRRHDGERHGRQLPGRLRSRRRLLWRRVRVLRGLKGRSHALWLQPDVCAGPDTHAGPVGEFRQERVPGIHGQAPEVLGCAWSC